MNNLSTSVQSLYRFLWTPDPARSPEQSGIYLTRNQRGQEWFRYFDARLGDWYMSWTEMRDRGEHGSARIHRTALNSEVAAWAHRTRLAQA